MTATIQRRKNNKYCYELTASSPTSNDQKKFYDINNLNHLCDVINANFFNSYPVVSRAMVNNWVFYPEKPRRICFNYFKIAKIEV